MKKYLLLTYALLVVLTSSSAQPTKRAQKKMKLGDYSSATKILERAVKKQTYRNTAIPLLAECYRMQDEPMIAKKWYSLAAGLPGALPEWTYYFAQALRSTGEYEKSCEKFMEYTNLRPDDPRGPLYISFCDIVMGPWKNNYPAFEIKAVNNINSSQSDFGPVFYAGELVFASDRNLNLYDNNYGWEGRGYFDMLNARPKAPNEFYEDMRSAKLFNGAFNKSYHDGPVFFVGDSLAYFTRTYRSKKKHDVTLKNHLEIFYSSSSEGKWSPLKPFFLNSPDYSVSYPTLSSDGKTLVFVSDMPMGVGGTDLWICRWDGEKWSKPENLGPEINSPGNEVFPSLQADGSLLFSSDGLPGYGGLDIFCSKPNYGQWSKPENLGLPLNSSYDDFAMNYAPNSSNGFFTSNRPGGMGSHDIYAFRKLDATDQVVTNKGGTIKP